MGTMQRSKYRTRVFAIGTAAAAMTLIVAACASGNAGASNSAPPSAANSSSASAGGTAGGASSSAGSHAALASGSAAGSGSAVASGSSTPSGPALTVGELFPFTGAKAVLSTWGTHGVATGIYEINHNGGVLGHQLKSSTADDAADAVDALPALRKLFLNQPNFVVGPFSPTIMAVIKEFEPNKVVDFMIGGTTQLNDMTNPWVFRTTASDSTEAVAMAYYAIKQGYKKAALIFDNSANSQGFVAPLQQAYQKLGGTVVSNTVIVPGQSSYRSELVKAFSGAPQVVFSSFDTQTASTLWANAGQLGYLDTPWVGDDQASSDVYAKAFGPKAATKLVSALPAAPSGQAYNHFVSDYSAVYPGKSPLPTTFNEYDAIVIAALAMTQAKSTDPSAWVKQITAVSNPPGQQCYDYASCLKLLNSGQKINFEGAGGNDDFNTNHNVFSGFEIQGFTSSNAPRQAGFVTAQEVQANASNTAFPGH